MNQNEFPISAPRFYHVNSFSLLIFSDSPSRLDRICLFSYYARITGFDPVNYFPITNEAKVLRLSRYASDSFHVVKRKGVACLGRSKSQSRGCRGT